MEEMFLGVPLGAWGWVGVAVLALFGAYNTIVTAIKNAREERRVRDSPTRELREEVSEINEKLANDNRRLNAHERRQDDFQHGLMALCSGVQALLDHELHDGNSNEMEEASKNIDKWLRERP